MRNHIPIAVRNHAADLRAERDSANDVRLDATILADLQSCPRRVVLSHAWRPLKWRPKSLFDACLRAAILDLSSGKRPVDAIASAAAERFLQSATNPGLDALGDTYKLAMDYCVMLETILRVLAKLTLLVVRECEPVQLTPSIQWTPTAWQDDSGRLHRWVTCDSWTYDDFIREVHGWHAFGDIAVLRKPMMLHAIVIGRTAKGRRASPWARGYQHPGLAGLPLRFIAKNGRTLAGWKARYLADLTHDPDEWAARLFADGAQHSLIYHKDIEVPSDSVCDDTIRQIMLEAARVRELRIEHHTGTFRALPMHRSACDGIVPCPWQHACYSQETDLAMLGVYEERKCTTTGA